MFLYEALGSQDLAAVRLEGKAVCCGVEVPTHSMGGEVLGVAFLFLLRGQDFCD